MDSEKELWWLNRRAQQKGIETHEFREPDFCLELTAVAFTPSDATRRFLSSLPCAGKNPAPEDAQGRERALRRLSEEMVACEQTPGLNVLEHGWNVAQKFHELWDYIMTGNEPDGWRLPSWLMEHRERFQALEPYLYEIEKYLIVHDCGKPRSALNRTVTQKFPDHARISAEVWSEHSDDEFILNLIRNDMRAHTAKACDTEAFREIPNYEILLLSALCEIHSNAEMFGGIDSTSFKIKWKNLDKLGRRVLQ